MASGTLGAEELPKKNKWSETSKVYTRKIFRNPKKNQSIDQNQGGTSEKSTVVNNGSDKNCIVNGTTTNNIVKNHESVVEEVPNNENGVHVDPTIINENVEKNSENVVLEVPCNENNVEKVPNNVNCIEQAHDRENFVKEIQICENNVEEAPQNENNVEEPQSKIYSPEVPIEEAILSQTQKTTSHVEAVTLSEDSASFNRVQTDLPNGHDHYHDGDLANGVVREERPMVTQVDDMLNISVTAAKSKAEVRNLKRKLEDELDQVRKMARMVEAKEIEVSSVGFGSGRLNVPINGGMNNGNVSMRATQELGSVSYSHPRPFGQLSVDVMDTNYYGGAEIPYEKEKRTPKANRNYSNSDFLLGKERLPPSESNRKTKSSGGGRKHRAREFDTGFAFDKNINKKCSDLLQKLRKHKLGWVFNQPVDVKSLGLHDYFDIISQPMDLGTVKTRLTNNWYKTPREFAEDVRLTFHNAMTYNPEGQDVHTMAKELLRIFEEKWPAIEVAYDRKLSYQAFRDVGTPTPTSRKSFAPTRFALPMPLPPPPLLHTPQPYQETRNFERSKSMPVRPSVGRKPALQKPKAKDVDKREMTFDEKQKLSTNLQCLPSEKLDLIVQIIKKRNTALSQHDDEIEVDIDSVDTETLWELDRFVTNYKKSLSKHKRRAEVAAQRAAAAQAIQETVPLAPAPGISPALGIAPALVPAPSNVEASREDRADDGNVATSPHVQQERHSNDGNNSSSSSSSGSDSGSSSSDSDSSSSSDSDSDEDN